MISFPNAKINLGLSVLSKRPDGYHNIETCFYPIPWNDMLEIIPAKETVFTSSGNNIPGTSASNLCLKTYTLLKEKYPLSPVHIHLHKRIPIGAGLGGGSSDAAFTCKLLNDVFALKLSAAEMEDIVRPVGSDCAFFIENTSILAHEKGDYFSHPGIVNLSGKWIYLIHPGIHVATKEAYDGVVPNTDRKPIGDILKQPLSVWKAELVNDFERSVFEKYPAIKTLKEQMYKQGAAYAAMSGSGSTVFGIFNTKPETFHENTSNIQSCIAPL
ncbi:4-(cytidine 5'-diphospho)-2-C-methyl-D-erythritol kinase [Cytophaga hutchinsonii]|uniref:4-diphosphocytidyl-2-C-methyl-D-erythritol kinase n=1 Tax=Cytophaga hutchinsonii (strain ATCC 33406 / DSM 1761 / CIP 103989 / NBRC 15051 / NCIMB 9469 / D465) TaxID=269798 RepID=ISPE_CYTH3|nr:4-(cytidine 5'-diphospho)-2-C-methyl-D-erythritol kinase [Cytophaga hutchinsonii]Q11VT3.1 RecName: Full=4-diphosphocytidyl-2-C-methyl-D-erythritol kinase; Short=CMK; AltName: Full=4-(cytidine-5'-diphospho)-2-C-methyl-D-erythritol kinase [Cytophaga hutchinsonii ATCC 33406]ABG58483.1 4-diphosphocytidyl-2-C-methyl-D-erythritol kinase [Cytophaga hutchinsonii ATCC 33406]SFX75388.1 4-diphosphocytidyl-2-C-methyl-D-erythritol kinase [Cytophaga hutchinsonii ATCC 33406]